MWSVFTTLKKIWKNTIYISYSNFNLLSSKCSEKKYLYVYKQVQCLSKVTKFNDVIMFSDLV